MGYSLKITKQRTYFPYYQIISNFRKLCARSRRIVKNQIINYDVEVDEV